MRKTYDKQPHGFNRGSIYRSYPPHTGGKIDSNCLLSCHPLLIKLIITGELKAVNQAHHMTGCPKRLKAT